MRVMSFWDKFFGPKPQGYCRICNRPIFDRDTKYGRMELCIYCKEAYDEGVLFTFEKKKIKKKVWV